MWQKEQIIAELQKRGKRITEQRKILLDVILEGNWTCCKEIYYQAVRQDPSIGIATVYRMVKTLEDIGAINRKNMYRINCEENCGFRGDCVLVLENKEKVSFSMEDFSHDHMTPNTLAFMETVVEQLEQIRKKYIEQGKQKEDWYDLIQLLPSSYNQMRTCSFNYETLINIYHARKAHKLAEWHEFCDWIKTLPYAKELIIAED